MTTSSATPRTTSDSVRLMPFAAGGAALAALATAVGYADLTGNDSND